MKRMKTSTGITYDSYGKNVHTPNIEGVIFFTDEITPVEVHNLEGFYLHPIKESNSMEIFAIKCTYSDMLQYYKDEINDHCSIMAIKSCRWHLGFSQKEYDAMNKVHLSNIAEFIPWFKK